MKTTYPYTAKPRAPRLFAVYTGHVQDDCRECSERTDPAVLNDRPFHELEKIEAILNATIIGFYDRVVNDHLQVSISPIQKATPTS